MFSFIPSIPNGYKIGILLIVAVSGFVSGWKVHSWKTDSATLKSEQKTEKIRNADISAGNKIVEKVEVVKEEIRYVTKEIIKEIPSLPDADHVCFTNESLSLWNKAIEGSNQYRTEPEEQTKASEAVETDIEAVATVEEVLLNATENAAICGENAANHNALIDRIESLEGKMCYCAQ